MADARQLLVFALLVVQILCFASHEASAATCHPSGFLRGKGEFCSKVDSCCVAGKRYPQFRCSPPVSAKTPTPATMTYTNFENGEDGAAIRQTSCDGLFHQDKELVIQLSSGWLRLDGTERCNMNVSISAENGRSVVAKVVDECDSVNGCDEENDYGPPCRNNVLNASPGVWKALRLNETIGEVKVTWSDVYG